MNKGINYTNAFEQQYSEKLLFLEVKRKDQIFLISTILALISLILVMVFPALLIIMLIGYLFSFFVIVAGVGFDYEEIPAYKFMFYMLTRRKRIRMAGRNYFTSKPQAIICKIRDF